MRKMSPDEIRNKHKHPVVSGHAPALSDMDKELQKAFDAVVYNSNSAHLSSEARALNRIAMGVLAQAMKKGQ